LAGSAGQGGFMDRTNKHNLPERWVRALGGLEQRPRRPRYRYGVTELVDAPLVRQLRIRHHDEIQEDVSDFLWAMYGQGVHGAMEDSADPNTLTEEKLTISRQYNGIECTLVGVPDHYNSEEHSADYKTSKAFYMIYDPQGKPEHRNQLHVYRLMLHEHGFDVKSQSLDVLCRDWDARRAAKEDDYPRLALNIIPVDVKPVEWIEDYVQKRLALHVEAESLDIEDVPQCTPGERWDKPTVYAVKKKTGSRAVRGGLHSDPLNAEAMVEDLGADKHGVEVRLGERTRCQSWCSVSRWCPSYQAYKQEQSKNPAEEAVV